MNRGFLCLLLPVLFGGVCLSSFAGQQPPVPDEFAVSQSISMTDQDEFYISPAASYFHFGTERDVTVEADMAYGFTDQLGVELDVPYEFVNPDAPSLLNPSQNGLNDISIQARYGVIDYRQHPFGLDVDLGFTLPTGVRPKRLVVNLALPPFQEFKVFEAGGLGEGQVNIVPAFTVSQWLGHFNLQVNFAWLRPISNGGAGPNNEYQYNVTLAYAIHHRFLAVEGNADSTSKLPPTT